MEEGGDLAEMQWGESASPRTSSRPPSGAAAIVRAERSGRDTPASVDSIPLEWDHDYDLSRDLESPGGRGERSRGQEEEEEDEYLRTSATVLSGWSHFIQPLTGVFWIDSNLCCFVKLCCVHLDFSLRTVSNSIQTIFYLIFIYLNFVSISSTVRNRLFPIIINTG